MKVQRTIIDAMTGETKADFVEVEEPPAPDIADVRANATQSKREFCLSLYRTGILGQVDAIAASRGEWPGAMAGFLSYLKPDQATDAQIEWAGAAVIERLNPIVLTLGSWVGLTDTQLDRLFGIMLEQKD